MALHRSQKLNLLRLLVLLIVTLAGIKFFFRDRWVLWLAGATSRPSLSVKPEVPPLAHEEHGKRGQGLLA